MITLLVILYNSLNGQAFSDQVNTMLSTYADDYAISIAIAEGEERYSDTYGFIDKKKQVETSRQTLFNVASISKAITAVGIMHLVAQSQLSLENTLDDLLTNVPEDKQAITIQMLLTHTTGYTQNYVCEGFDHSDKALEVILNDPLVSTPGEEFHYANQNFQLLALIIEKISGQDFEWYIREKVFEPLGMTNTYCWREIESQQVAMADKRLMKTFGNNDWGYKGATGIFSTPRDLLRFWQGVSQTDYLPSDLKDKLFKGHVTLSSGTQIGFGFYVTPESKWGMQEVWTRGSESWGHNAVIRHFPENDVTIVVCTNSGEVGKEPVVGNRMISDLLGDHLFE